MNCRLQRKGLCQGCLVNFVLNQCLVNKEFIIWPERKLFLTGATREIPSGAHLARSVSQSECGVRFISCPVADSAI